MAVETSEYLAMVARMIRAGGRRVADADETELADLVALRAELDQAIETAVLGQRASLGRSWAWVGQGLGVSRQAAQQRYSGREQAATLDASNPKHVELATALIKKAIG